MPTNLSDQLESSPKEKKLLEQERLILEVTELICEIMEEEGVNRSELAKRLRRSKGHVSQLLDGSRNMTLKTLADILTALGRRGNLRALVPARLHSQSSTVSICLARGASWSCDDVSCDLPWLENVMAG